MENPEKLSTTDRPVDQPATQSTAGTLEGQEREQIAKLRSEKLAPRGTPEREDQERRMSKALIMDVMQNVKGSEEFRLYIKALSATQKILKTPNGQERLDALLDRRAKRLEADGGAERGYTVKDERSLVNDLADLVKILEEEEEKRKAAEEAAKKAKRSRATKEGVRRRERELAKTPDDLWGFTTQSRALYDFGHLKFELTAGGGAVAEVEGQFKATLKRLPKGRGQNSPVLDVFTRKLFVWLRMKVLAQLNELGKDGLTDTAIANIRRSKAVTVTPEAIAPDFGLTDQRRRNIGPQLKEALMILRGAYWEYVDERQKGKDGKYKFLQVNVADQLSGEKKSGNDVFRFEFSQPFAELLAKCRLMYINKKLFQIDAHKNPHSFYIADKLLDHYNQNIGKPNANRIRVCNLLKACPDLKKYEEIMSTTRQVGKRIKDPFERDFDALLLQEYDRGKYGILKSLRFCKDKGESLIAEGADDNPGIEDETEERMTDWGEYANLIVEFDWANIPDQTKWIKERKALTKAAKATKTQKAEKTKGRRGRPSKAKAANSPDQPVQPVGKEA